MKQNFELRQCLSDNGIDFHCLLDIDNFSSFNSKYSFEKGNNVLLKISEIAKRELKPKYWIHLESDEYYFSASKNWSKPESPIFKFMQKLNSSLNITVSIGIVESKNQPPSEIFSILKTNVLNAKNNGKNLIYSL